MSGYESPTDAAAAFVASLPDAGKPKRVPRAWVRLQALKERSARQAPPCATCACGPGAHVSIRGKRGRCVNHEGCDEYVPAR